MTEEDWRYASNQIKYNITILVMFFHLNRSKLYDIVRQINTAADKYNKDGEFTAMVMAMMVVTMAAMMMTK